MTAFPNPIMGGWRNGSALLSYLDMQQSKGCRFESCVARVNFLSPSREKKRAFSKSPNLAALLLLYLFYYKLSTLLNPFGSYISQTYI